MIGLLVTRSSIPGAWCVCLSQGRVAKRPLVAIKENEVCWRNPVYFCEGDYAA